MLDSIRLRCPECDHVFHQSVAYVTGQIKAMKIHKRDEVAQQMADKRGPFYDKWLKAMKARGEQKRCKTCISLRPDDPSLFSNYCIPHLRRVNPGQFACRLYIRFDR